MSLNVFAAGEDAVEPNAILCEPSFGMDCHVRRGNFLISQYGQKCHADRLHGRPQIVGRIIEQKSKGEMEWASDILAPDCFVWPSSQRLAAASV
jgi:hypothetical protein